MRINLLEAGVPAGQARPVTREIQHAIDLCHAAPAGGVVEIPAGEFLTGTLILRSRVHLELEPGAVLLGSADPADYPVQPAPAYRSLHDVRGFRALIYAEGAEDISLSGPGTIDGQGAKFLRGNNDQDGRPRLLQFVSCRDVRVQDLRLRNSALWMQHYLDCERVQIRGLQVWNHANRNNDFIDIDGCREFTMSDCVGDTDDDGITLKSTGPAACENVAIANCIVSSRCNAIKLGTESTGGFRNIAISNCTVKPSSCREPILGHDEGISGLSLELVDGGVLDGVLVSNLAIDGTLAPLFIRLGDRGRPHQPGLPRPAVGRLRNVKISHVIARNAGAIGSSLTGIPGHRIENISLSDVHLELARAAPPADSGRRPDEREQSYPEAKMWGSLPACGFFVRHARNVSFHNVTVAPAAGESRPWLVTDDVIDSPTVAGPA